MELFNCLIKKIINNILMDIYFSLINRTNFYYGTQILVKFINPLI
jgi:hypothetical protein